MRRTFPAEPVEPTEPAPLLFRNAIKLSETVERSIGPSPPSGEMPKAEGVHFLGR